MTEVSRLPRDAVLVWLSFLRDSTGRSFIPADVVATVMERSAAPVYSPYDLLRKGRLGGYGESFASMGRTAADVLLEIFDGKDPAAIPPRTSPDLGYWVDHQVLQRFGLDERNIPAGATVADKVPSLWDMYRWHAIGAISVIALQALLIAGLIVQRQRRKVAEADIRAKASALRVSHENISRLNGQLIDAEEAERARIARELHDDVGQRVASLSIGLSSLKRRATGSDGALRSELSDLQQTAVNLAKDLRNLSHELHPRELQQVGLREALRARCEELDVEANVKVELDVGNEWSEPPDPITVCLYRVAQEALHNIAKHANARTGRISLARHGGEVVMRIVDDGRGFESDAPEGQHGIGLQSMRERVRMLGGSFRVQSSKGSGTVATVRIPTEARV